MFNWFDKLLVKIAKKILNKYAPQGEFIAYINEQEEKVLKKLGGYGQPVNETGVKSFIPEWLKIAGKVAGSAAKYYIDYKDQERKSEVAEKAYNEYAAQVAESTKQAQAAVDVGLTPMEILNIPTTKADVSDFTAVAAHGGLMNLPNRQRKRYAYQGFVDDDDIEIMEPESLGDFELKQEEGVNIGQQVFHDTGDDRTNAQQVWDSGAIDQEIYQLDFEIFLRSGDWMDHISRGTVQGDTMMASAPGIPGIESLRHGGRIGYSEGSGSYVDYVKAMKALGKQPMPIDIFNSLEGFMTVKEMIAMGSPEDKAHGGRIGYDEGSRDPIYQDVARWMFAKDVQDLTDDEYLRLIKFTRENDAKGGQVGRIKYIYWHWLLP